MTVDYLQLAWRSTRERFVEICGCPFLVGTPRLNATPPPRRTAHFEAGSTAATPLVQKPGAPPSDRPLVIAVRKVQATFESMITVGRTRNNDIVLLDVEISKLHAYFREEGGRFEISDAGSANGTRVGENRLIPQGAPHALRSGDDIFFAKHQFQFLDARDCWIALQKYIHRPAGPAR